MANTLPRTRKPSELIKRGFGEEETKALYELGRFLLECGDLFKAEAIFKGLITVAPEYIWPKIGLSYVALVQQNFEVSLARAEEALALDPDSPEALLFKSTALLKLRELSSAGATLGELTDRDDQLSPQAKRLLTILLASFESDQRAQS